MTATMSDGNALNERIDALEMRLTYQDEAIETLNQTITKQWLEIDRLKSQLSDMKERLQEAESHAPGPANEPPPHY
jgi:SlyX protein